MEIIDKVDNYLLNNKNYGKFFNVYPFANENIDEYLQFFDLENRSLLTVGSSGDQAINASMAGCKNITVCDICPLSKYFYYLKISALLSLKREEFIKFLSLRYVKGFKNSNPDFFNKKIYNKIKSTLEWLDYESFLVWEYITTKYSPKDISRLFKDDIQSLDIALICNKYLKSDDNYNKAKDAVISAIINFVNMDILSFKSNKKYDNIWLSNVAQYLNSDEISILFDSSSKLITSKGKILLYYSWHSGIVGIHGLKVSEYTNLSYDEKTISGVLNPHIENSLAIHTNKPKILVKK